MNELKDGDVVEVRLFMGDSYTSIYTVTYNEEKKQQEINGYPLSLYYEILPHRQLSVEDLPTNQQEQ